MNADMTAAAVEKVFIPQQRDVGGFDVRRLLPSAECRAVGPFVFFDQFGPMKLTQGRSLEVRPHPHIGLATITYSFAGTIMHRDSLGTVQPIHPGEVNWMTAGRGIVHSERTSGAGNPPAAELFGIQTWVALPRAKEEMEPAFAHHGRDELPEIEGEGVWSRVILGAIFNRRSPVVTVGDPVYVDCRLELGRRMALPVSIEERGLCVVSGRLDVGGRRLDAGTLAVFTSGNDVVVIADVPARLILFGGPRLEGPRHVWWNFVSSSRERIEAAKSDWRQGGFPTVPGDQEFIPLPE
jgi:redox-sensitive bicupin YhaK (pirin superfamily)